MIKERDLVAILPALTAFSQTLVRKDKSMADDLLQDTVLRMLEKQHLFDGINLKSWAFKIMQRIYINSKRGKDFTNGAVELDLIILRQPDIRIDDIIDFKRRWPSLSPKYKAMLTAYVEGDSYREIAAKLGITSIKAEMNRIREHLRP
jgi:RNA polymerase sigma factor (sigma-70 family)